MNKKIFTEKIIVATSQYFTIDFTRKFYNSLKKDNIPFTFAVAFDGSPSEKVDELSDIVDISLVFKKPLHSIPEIFNCLFNLAKSTDAEFILIGNNDQIFKEGSFKSIVSLIDKYDVISPVKIDNDKSAFDAYNSNEDPVEVIGFNDTTWLIRLNKISWNPIDRNYGPFNFEEVPFIYQLWKDGVRFCVDPRAVILHYCSQDTQYCFTSEDRDKYSKEWNTKRDYFLANNGPSAKWFFDNVTMNKKGIERFGYPVYIKE